MLNLDAGIDMKAVSEKESTPRYFPMRSLKTIEANLLAFSSTWVSTRVFNIRPYLLIHRNPAHDLILGPSIISAHHKKPWLVAMVCHKDSAGVCFPL